MQHITIGDANIPVIGLGTYTLTGDSAIDLISNAIKGGYRHIDTAQFYNNEEEVGTAIQKSGISRSEIFLTTKVWPSNLSKADFLPSVEESLRKLKTDYVDLLLIHWPNRDIPVSEKVGELVKAQEKGMCKHIGVSNFPVALLSASLEITSNIIVNQVEYHPFLDQKKLLNFQQERNVMLTAYSPIAQGKVINHELIKDLAAKYGKNPAQISLRWLIQQEGVAAIPRSKNIDRLMANMNVFDFELLADEMVQISALGSRDGRLVNPPNGPDWD